MPRHRHKHKNHRKYYDNFNDFLDKHNLEMTYACKKYIEFCQSIKDYFTYDRHHCLKNSEPYESHHICPRRLCGKSIKRNLVLLTREEHIKAHELLDIAIISVMNKYSPAMPRDPMKIYPANLSGFKQVHK